jgi:hypothetical protein
MDLKRLAKLAQEDPAKFGVLVKPMRIHFSLSPQSLGNEAQGSNYSFKYVGVPVPYYSLTVNYLLMG